MSTFWISVQQKVQVVLVLLNWSLVRESKLLNCHWYFFGQKSHFYDSFFYPSFVFILFGFVLGSISSTFYIHSAFTRSDPKCIKKKVKLSILFMLPGSMSVKALCKTLAKLTLGRCNCLLLQSSASIFNKFVNTKSYFVKIDSRYVILSPSPIV